MQRTDAETAAAVAAVNRSPIFEHVSLKYVRQLVAGAEVVVREAGEYLFREGDPADAFYIVESGVVRTWVSRPAGAGRTRQTMLRELHAGSCLGEVELAFQEPCQCTALVQRRARLWRVRKAQFAELMDVTPFRLAICGVDFEGARLREVAAAQDRVNAELIVVRPPGRPDFPLGRLIELMAQAQAGEYRDRVVVVRPTAGEPRAGGAPARPGGPSVAEVPVVEVPAMPDDLRRGDLWARLVPDYDFVFVDLSGCPEPARRGWYAAADRVVHVLEDPQAVDPPPDGVRYQPVVLIPPGGFPGAPAAPPALPVGAVRVRLDLRRLAQRGGDFAQLTADDPNRAALLRLVRGISDRTVGLALGGGGAWGFAHVALIRALHQRKVPIDIISGSSFGAVVGAFYAADGLAGLDLLEREVGPQLRRALPRAYLDSGAIERVVGRHLGGWLEDLDTVLLPCVTSVQDARLHVYRQTTIARGVRASGSFPLVFPATLGHLSPDRRPARFVDGGIASNVPDSVLIEEGADLVVASNVVPPPPPLRKPLPDHPKGPLRTWFREFEPRSRVVDMLRSAFILMHAASVSDAHLADVLFNAPYVEWMPWQFDRGTQIIAEVQAAAAEAAQEVEGRWTARKRLVN